MAWWWWRRLKGNWYPRKMITITKLPKLDWKFVDHVELEYKNFELKGLFLMRRMKMNFALTMLSSIKIMWLKINLRSMKVILMLVGRAIFCLFHENDFVEDLIYIEKNLNFKVKNWMTTWWQIFVKTWMNLSLMKK